MTTPLAFQNFTQREVAVKFSKVVAEVIHIVNFAVSWLLRIFAQRALEVKGVTKSFIIFLKSQRCSHFLLNFTVSWPFENFCAEGTRSERSHETSIIFLKRQRCSHLPSEFHGELTFWEFSRRGHSKWRELRNCWSKRIRYAAAGD